MTRTAIERKRVASSAKTILHSRIFVKLLAKLIEVRDLKLRSETNATLLRRQLAKKHSQQRCFANAVGANDADFIASHDGRREIADDRLLRIRERNTLNFRD
jgi:hypothetical protein